MGRKFFVGGNWKCNGTLKSVEGIVSTLNAASIPSTDVVEVVVAPTAVHIPYVQSKLRKEIAVAAQNAWVKGSGAYTGELSAEILADLGLQWVILGHSERRSLLKESSKDVAEKTAYANSKGLSVILCVGETLEQREAGSTGQVVAEQLEAVTNAISTKDWASIVIAYEPVWAIGTGKVATPEQAQETHVHIRQWLVTHTSPEVAEETRILYGGSVSAKNCDSLATQPDIDGFLVGGASLKPDFVDIIKSAEKAG